MDQMSGFLNSSEPAPAAAPEPNFITLVSGRDDTPEGAGIVRLVGSPDQPTASATPETPADAAVPPQPPKTKKRAATATAARGTQSATETRTTDGRSANR
jgi:hypothetical protein